MTRPLPAFCGVSVALALVAGGAPSAHAQTLVYDATSYAKLIQQAQTAISQLEQLKQQVSQSQTLLNDLNPVSSVNAIASGLSAPSLRAVLPDAGAFTAAGQGNLAALGPLGQAALAIRTANRLYTPAPGDAAGADLEAAGDRAARDLATGQSIATAGATRLQGLQTLQTAIAAAPNARAVLDLNARIGVEQAMTANDQMRVQALTMTQAAEAKMEQQRAQERAAAAADARMAFYKSGFQ